MTSLSRPPSLLSPVRSLTCLFVIFATACSTAHEVAPVAPIPSASSSVSEQTRNLLSRAGVAADSVNASQLDAQPELLVSLSPAERSLALSDLYLAESLAGSSETARHYLLRATHYAFSGLQEEQCQGPVDAVCRALAKNYARSLTTIMRGLQGSAWSERMPITNGYDLHLNGDGGTIDINEWRLTFPKAPASDESESFGLVGAVAVACRTEERVNDEPLFSTCLPVLITATFEGAPSSLHGRVYLSAASLTSDPNLSADAVTESWIALNTLVQSSPPVQPAIQAHLGCVGEVNRTRPTTITVLDTQYPIEPWAEISTAVSSDQILHDAFNFCTYTDYRQEVTAQTVTDLSSAISSHLAPVAGIFVARRPSKVVFVTQGPHSGELVTKLRENAKRVGRSALPEIETTGVFALSPHLFTTAAEGASTSTSIPLPVASISVAERDIRRLLTKVIEQQAPSIDGGEETPDFTLSPVM